MKKSIIVLLSLVIAVCFSKISVAHEHPGEALESKMGRQHKEHPGKEHPGMAISSTDIHRAIEAYIRKDSRLKGGYFLFYDAKDRKTLRLSFIRVHKRVSFIKKDNAYFACTDFRAVKENIIYDLDFWMKKDHHGELNVYKIMVHKKDGRPRFTYSDDQIMPLEATKMAPEGQSGSMLPKGHSGSMVPEEHSQRMAPEQHS